MLRHKSCQPVPDFSTPKASTLWSQVTVELRVDGDQDLSQCGTIKIKKKTCPAIVHQKSKMDVILQRV